MINTVTKRNGNVVPFDENKIYSAVSSAFFDVYKEINDDNEDKINTIVDNVVDTLMNFSETMHVESIQDIVEKEINEYDFNVAKAFILYRSNRAVSRSIKGNLQDRYNKMISLVKGEDEESKKENSNKDTRILPTMRDYIAGFTCREMADNIILPKDIAEAHKNGEIHFHDSDYSPAMPMTNCCLINLEDMLNNGTVISGTLIETPHTFRTACTVATQIVTQVASCQYGGNTISLAHIAPFVDKSRQQYRRKHPNFSAEDIELLVREEVSDGIQTIQYQLITMSTTNGQSPFTSVFMYIDEAPEGTTRDDLVMIIEEVLKQRMTGVKNEQGEYVTTAFPKLLYVLDENNIREDSKYWYLTKLAAECSAHRLVPDYISAKKMRELKENNVFGCMG